MCATTQLARLVSVSWVMGWACRFTLTPPCAAFACGAAISDASQPMPEAYGKVKLSALPLAIPGPHLAGSAQVVTPPGFTVQPLLDSSALALAMLNGYGPSPDLVSARPVGDRNLLSGVFPTGPTVGSP